MPKVLRNLKIDEVSAVDAGAGEDCRVLLRKRQDVVGKATAALETSVGLILDSDGSEEEKRQELVETFTQFETYLDRNVAGSEALSKGPLERAERRTREAFAKIFAGKAADDGGDDVAKARRDRHVGHHSLAAAVVEHTIDRLSDLRRKHGFEKAHTIAKETTTMDREQELTSILKRDGGLAALCKSILDDGAHRVIDGGAISEAEFVEVVTKHASERFPNEAADVAFSKLFAASTSEATLLRKAHKAVRNSAFAGAGYPMPG
jgi:hypothetical protein